MIPDTLPMQAAAYRILKQELIDKYGFTEDDQALLDTLEGVSDYVDQLRSMLRFARERQTWVVANQIAMEALKARTDGLKAQVERIMTRVRSTMENNGPRRIDAPDFSYSLVSGKIGLVGDCDPNELPDEFVRVKREPNRLAILAALKEGKHVPGFSLSNGSPHLKVNS